MFNTLTLEALGHFWSKIFGPHKLHSNFYKVVSPSCPFLQVHCPVNSGRKKERSWDTASLSTKTQYISALFGGISSARGCKGWKHVHSDELEGLAKWQFHTFPCDAGCLPAYQSHGATICCKMVGSKVIMVAMNWYWEYQNETLIGKVAASRFQQSHVHLFQN